MSLYHRCRVVRLFRTSSASVDSSCSVSQKIPPEVLWQFSQNAWEFFEQILRAYYAFLYTLGDEFLLLARYVPNVAKRSI